jgi:hypothetical protein
MQNVALLKRGATLASQPLLSDMASVIEKLLSRMVAEIASLQDALLAISSHHLDIFYAPFSHLLEN